MPQTCAVLKCGNRSNRDLVRFFRLPAHTNFKHKITLNDLSRERRKKWLCAINRPELEGRELHNVRVCSRHFLNGKPANMMDKCNPDWIPTQWMGYRDGDKSPTQIKMDSYECSGNIEEEIITIQVEETEAEVLPQKESAGEEHLQNNKSVQTDITMDQLSEIIIECNINDNDKIRKHQTAAMSYKLLEGDDAKTLFYTGLPTFVLFTIVCQYVTPYLAYKKPHAPEDQCLLTLMKLRLNLEYKHLAYRFEMSPSTAERTFKHVIHVMYIRFKNFVFWPKREALFKTMPSCFKEAFHEKSTVIIECFEMKLEESTGTKKYLIGITPQETICYVSEGWEGRVSDKLLTESFSNNIVQGDIVMAGRDFLMEEFAQMFDASVRVPAFIKGKTHLDPTDLEATPSIAHCRIHVEGVIEALRQKHRILNSVLSVQLLATDDNEKLLDEIIFVCCALVNICPPLVRL